MEASVNFKNRADPTEDRGPVAIEKESWWAADPFWDLWRI